MIVPSIIAKKEDECRTIIDNYDFVKHLHLDIMDGEFVENTSLDFDLGFLHTSRHTYEAHLMVKYPLEYISKLLFCKRIYIHTESAQTPEAIQELQKLGIKAGIALRPETDIQAVRPYLGIIDSVLLLSVDPGKYGAAFHPDILYKIRHMHKEFPSLRIKMDGAMKPTTIVQTKMAGAREMVVGSYLLSSNHRKKTFDQLETL